MLERNEGRKLFACHYLDVQSFVEYEAQRAHFHRYVNKAFLFAAIPGFRHILTVDVSRPPKVQKDTSHISWICKQYFVAKRNRYDRSQL